MPIFFRIVETIRNIDWWFFGPICFLISIGLIMQYSIGVNQEIIDLSQFYKQLTFVFIGLAGALIMNIIDYRTLKTHPLAYIITAIIILLTVLFFGTTIKGTTGWFVIGGFSLQPVEIVKILLILFMSAYFEGGDHIPRSPRYLFAAGGTAAIIVSLVMLQPDLGSAIILFMIWLSYMLMLRAPVWFLALVMTGVVGIFTLGWYIIFEDYQRDRLITFINPEIDPLGTGYNITQSLTAIGSGGLWGKGLGLGTQSQLRFLPEINSDFIFAAIAEELGFIVVTLLILAIAILIFRMGVYIKNAKDLFGALVVFGVSTYILFQSIMTIGMNLSLLPVTGLPLPLISAGGSSMLITLILLGICHKIGKQGSSR